MDAALQFNIVLHYGYEAISNFHYIEIYCLDSFSAALRKRYAITNPGGLITSLPRKKAALEGCFLRRERKYNLYNHMLSFEI